MAHSISLFFLHSSTSLVLLPELMYSRLTDYDMTSLRTLLYHLALVGLADRHGKEWN